MPDARLEERGPSVLRHEKVTYSGDGIALIQAAITAACLNK